MNIDVNKYSLKVIIYIIVKTITYNIYYILYRYYLMGQLDFFNTRLYIEKLYYIFF